MELYSSLSLLIGALIVIGFLFWLAYKLLEYFVIRDRMYMAALAAIPKILALLDPPLVTCSSCQRAIPVTPSFRIDGICPHCGTAHNPKSIAKAVG